MYVCMYIWMYVCMHISVYVCMCGHMYVLLKLADTADILSNCWYAFFLLIPIF